MQCTEEVEGEQRRKGKEMPEERRGGGNVCKERGREAKREDARRGKREDA